MSENLGVDLAGLFGRFGGVNERNEVGFTMNVGFSGIFGDGGGGFGWKEADMKCSHLCFDRRSHRKLS